jgi:molybdate transport system regulatory protein
LGADLPVFPGSVAPARFDSWRGRAIKYLGPGELHALEDAWQQARATTTRPRQFGRYFLVFLLLRHTGARLGEVLRLDDTRDVDFRNAEVRLVTLKQRTKKGPPPMRIVPVPPWVTNEIAAYVVQFPGMQGKAFRLRKQNFWIKFKDIALGAGIPGDLAHPHALRHTRAIEMLRAGVPVTVVQDVLGHSSLTTTAVYLRMSGAEAKAVLKERGLI